MGINQNAFIGVDRFFKIVGGIVGAGVICGLIVIVSHTETITEQATETIQYQVKNEYHNAQREGT